MAIEPSHDPDYLARREAQERKAAEQAADPAARRVHKTLADHYAGRRKTPPAEF